MYPLPEENRRLRAKYAITGWLYDLLDFPWEIQYRRWRPGLLQDLRGEVLEAGVGTGRNLPFYPKAVSLIGIDLSQTMLRRAARRKGQAVCRVELREEDATTLDSIPSNHFDWLISTFLCCVMSDRLQPKAIDQFARVLKPGGRFRLLEMVYSNRPGLRRRQQWFAPFVETVYGARFDRQTLKHLQAVPQLRVLSTRFLKQDTYLLIEGERL